MFDDAFDEDRVSAIDLNDTMKQYLSDRIGADQNEIPANVKDRANKRKAKSQKNKEKYYSISAVLPRRP